MDDGTWKKVARVVSPRIRKMRVIDFAFVFPILLSIYLTLRICPTKLSADDMLFP